MASVRSSEWLWKKGGGYYTESSEALVSKPVLPDTRRLFDRRLFGLFERYGDLGPGARVLEIGCGRSPWLPHLARSFGASVSGIDIEPHAADLARANLAGASVSGEIHCRDAFILDDADGLKGAFDLVYSRGVLEHFDDAAERLEALALYLRPGGRVLTTVPNMQGVNWLLQRMADLKTLEIHVVYDVRRLVEVHEKAGFRTIAAGYVGFFDGFLSSDAGCTRPARRRLHQGVCRALNLCSEGWLRLGGPAPELGYLAPHVFCVGVLPGGDA